MISADVLLTAYRNGIFPMAEGRKGSISWYTADPRGVLDPKEFHCPKRLARTYRSGKYRIGFDTSFEAVIRGCANVLRGGNWISEEIVESYINLHRLGYAHSVESYSEHTGELSGGLYGVALGGIFFGESMFHLRPDASKVAMVALVDRLRSKGFLMIDIQMLTPHTQRFGGKYVPPTEYKEILTQTLTLNVDF